MASPFGGGGVAGADTYAPGNAKVVGGALRRLANFVGEGADRGDPNGAQATAFYNLVCTCGRALLLLFRQILQQNRDNERVGFSTARGRIDQPALPREIGPPGLVLEGKGLPVLLFKPRVAPGHYGRIDGSIVVGGGHCPVRTEGRRNWFSRPGIRCASVSYLASLFATHTPYPAYSARRYSGNKSRKAPPRARSDSGWGRRALRLRTP